MEKLNLKEGIYLHVVTSLSSLDFGTCLILCSFSWLKWFKSNYDILRVDSAHVWDIERVAQFWPTPQLVDGIWMEDCTTASWQQQHATVAVSRKTFFTAGMQLSQTQWGSFERATQSTHGHFTYAVPSGMPIFDSELVVELWEGFHFKLKGLESFGQRVTNWDLRHSETMHFSGSMMINDG